MARIEWVEQRLDAWALWIIRGRRCGGGSVHPMWRDAPPDPNEIHEARVPVDEEECWLTDRQVRALPDPLAETVGAYYLHGSIYARDRLKISSSLLSQRIQDAHRRLAEALRRPSGPESLRGPSYHLLDRI